MTFRVDNITYNEINNKTAVLANRTITEIPIKNIKVIIKQKMHDRAIEILFYLLLNSKG